ncbi:GFA family protein [Microvirga sp. CF3062]|uniref:GFA family protein n=1 Tax=Microvirga sp. CF3062 TaxID=3110182 RepID=UPI002E78EC3A|nr:GFA family protein [Microvirga sp. CF3062]MEE1656521.1 GFA family protein [Microvirga sp. CF3062]
MADQDIVHEGGCRCGQVRIRVTGAPLMTMACHCTGCQRMTSSAFSLSALYPSDRFEVGQGEPVIGGLHGPTRHFFCPHCMSWLFTRPEGLDEFVNVRATMMDDTKSFSPFIESYTSEALPWAKTPALHSFETDPSDERFMELVTEFARQSAHPRL